MTLLAYILNQSWAIEIATAASPLPFTLMGKDHLCGNPRVGFENVLQLVESITKNELFKGLEFIIGVRSSRWPGLLTFSTPTWKIGLNFNMIANCNKRPFQLASLCGQNKQAAQTYFSPCTLLLNQLFNYCIHCNVYYFACIRGLFTLYFMLRTFSLLVQHKQNEIERECT